MSRASGEIADEIRKGGKKLGVLLEKSLGALKARNVEISDEAERLSPITLPAGFPEPE